MPEPTFDEIYAAMERRSPQFDGLYFTAVKTTKIFCRPVCPARTPLARNVEFFKTAQEAMLAGYRPCKRCRPLDMGAKAPEWVELLRERVQSDPGKRLKDQDLREMGLEPVQVRRVFRKRYNMTFHAYQREQRMGIALSQIRGGADAVDAAMSTGYASDSGFREAFAKVLGAMPHQAESVAPAWAKWLETPLGPMLAIAVDEGLALLEYVDRRMLETQLKTFARVFERRIVPGSHPHLDQITTELCDYFEGSLREFKTPIVLKGTAFQERAWRALLEIPYGETRTYGEQAAKIGNPDAQRAVGKANGDNRLAIIVPCHRVNKSDGTLCGYGGGLWRKQWLLDLERGDRTLGL